MTSGSSDLTIKIWDIVNGKLIYAFNQSNELHRRTPTSLISLENGFLVSCSRDGFIKIWDVKIEL